jgi:hypothetical protein
VVRSGIDQGLRDYVRFKKNVASSQNKGIKEASTVNIIVHPSVDPSSRGSLRIMRPSLEITGGWSG